MRGKYHMWSFTWNHWWDHLWISSWGKDLRKVDTTSADQRTEETESGTFKETARNVWVWWNQTSVRYSDRGGELDIPQRHPQQEVTLDVGGRKWVQTGGVSSRILEQNAIFFSFLFFFNSGGPVVVDILPEKNYTDCHQLHQNGAFQTHPIRAGTATNQQVSFGTTVLVLSRPRSQNRTYRGMISKSWTIHPTAPTLSPGTFGFFF